MIATTDIPAPRHAAQAEIAVRIARNDLCGWSIYPANAAARALFSGDEGAGNFPHRHAAHDRATRNCWTVIGPLARAENPISRRP